MCYQGSPRKKNRHQKQRPSQSTPGHLISPFVFLAFSNVLFVFTTSDRLKKEKTLGVAFRVKSRRVFWFLFFIFRMHPPGGLFMGRAETGRHCTVQKPTPSWTGRSHIIPHLTLFLLSVSSGSAFDGACRSRKERQALTSHPHYNSNINY